MTTEELTLELLDQLQKALTEKLGGFPAYAIDGRPFLQTWAALRGANDLDGMDELLRPLEEGAVSNPSVTAYEPLPRPYATN